MTKTTNIPPNICLEAKKFMKDLLQVMEDKSISTALDSAAINLIAQTYHNYIEATKILQSEGMIITVTTNAGENIKAHPAVKIQLDSQIQLHKLLVEFGLTPKSRKEITTKATKVEETKSPLDEFLGRKREVR